MLIETKATERDSNYHTVVYSLVDTEPCCSDMDEQFGYNGSVRLGEMSSILNPRDEATIMLPRHYPEGCHEEYIAIDYCPWCGAEITTEVVERVREVKEETTVEKTMTRREEVPVD